MTLQQVGLVGASGFVGRATLHELRRQGNHVICITAPRIRSADGPTAGCAASYAAEVVADLATALTGCQMVVNAAGLAEPSAADWPALAGANGVLPSLIADAATAAGVERMVHVSSMAVQGGRSVVDASPVYDAFSPYSRSKQLGEQVLLRRVDDRTPLRIMILRPGSVHGAARPTTQALVRYARSRLSCVAGAGEQPTPQNLVQNVAGAISYLINSIDSPPIVLQPWEGVTTAGLLRSLGGKEPRHVPIVPALGLVHVVRAASAVRPSARAWSRRLEMLWFGQRQAVGYLERAEDYCAVAGEAQWAALGRQG